MAEQNQAEQRHHAPPSQGQKQPFRGHAEQCASPGLSERLAQGMRSAALEVNLSHSAAPTAQKSGFLVSSAL